MTISRRTLLKGGIGAAAAGTALIGGCGMHTYDRATPLVTADRRSRILASPHYIDGEFRPEIPHRKVKMDASGWMKFLSPEAGIRIPAAPLPSVRTNLRELPADRDLVVWLGHSSFYMQLSGLRILIDPVFSTYALMGNSRT